MPKFDPKQEVLAVVESAEVKPFTYRNGKRTGQEGQMLKAKLVIRRPDVNRDTGEDEVREGRFRVTVFDSDNQRAHSEYTQLVERLQEGNYVHCEGHLKMAQWQSNSGEWYSWLEMDQTAFDFNFEDSAPETDPPVPTEGYIKTYELRTFKRTAEDGGDEFVSALDLTLVHRFAVKNKRGSYETENIEWKMTFWPSSDSEQVLPEGKNPEALNTLLQKLSNEGIGVPIRVLGYPGVHKDDYHDTVDTVIRLPEIDLAYGEIAKLHTPAPELVGAAAGVATAAAASTDDDWL